MGGANQTSHYLEPMARAHLPPPDEDEPARQPARRAGRNAIRDALSTIMGRALPDAVTVGNPCIAASMACTFSGSSIGASFRMCEDRRRRHGLFHPHGDQSIYDALVRLAQDSPRASWSTGRVISAISTVTAPPLIATPNAHDGGRPRAAQGIDEDAVDFRDYSGDMKEPVVLPPLCRTCLPMARRALRSAWRPRSRRTMSLNCWTPRSI